MKAARQENLLDRVGNIGNSRYPKKDKAAEACLQKPPHGRLKTRFFVQRLYRKWQAENAINTEEITPPDDIGNDFWE